MYLQLYKLHFKFTYSAFFSKYKFSVNVDGCQRVLWWYNIGTDSDGWFMKLCNMSLELILYKKKKRTERLMKVKLFIPAGTIL